MRHCVFLISFLYFGVLYSQQLRVGVFRDYSIKRITFSYNDGGYSIYGDTSYFGVILPNEFVELSSEPDGKVKLKKGTVELGEFKTVFLYQNVLNTSMTLTSKTPVIKARKYEDDFEIVCNNGNLIIVNLVEMDNYLSGVVESEGGGGRHLEYYKVQAVMSRTYAYKYKGKHNKEGFDICDRVHCQAYHSMMRFTPSIDSAVQQTHNVVLTNYNNDLLESYFHANCGGQTCEPQYVWNGKIDYLTSFKDTFCIYTKQSKWEVRVSQDKWKEFLIKKYNFPIDDSVCATMIYTFDQSDRKAFYLHPVFGIPLRDLREEFNLKSTYFSCYPEGSDVVIKGRGFGHGVGLCQEGAMKMAKTGFDYEQILKYYFPGSTVNNIQNLYYFNQKSPELNPQ